MKNKGIIQSGGSINANNLSVGDNAFINSDNQQLNVSNNDLKEINGLLDKVIAELLKAEVGNLDKEEIIDSVKTLQVEANKEKPNKITIRSIGKTILENLKYVKDIAPLFQMAFEKVVDFIK